MTLKDWTNDLMDEGDHQLGNIQVWRKKSGLRPYVETIELRKTKHGDYHLIGSYWDLIFKSKSEARAYAIKYMKEH